MRNSGFRDVVCLSCLINKLGHVRSWGNLGELVRRLKNTCEASETESYRDRWGCLIFLTHSNCSNFS